MKRLASLISPIIREFGMEEAVRLEEIKRTWTDIFREQLTAHMSPSGLKNSELLVNVDSPIWLQQLTFLKIEIIKNLQPYGVRDIRFRIGRVMRSYEKTQAPGKGSSEKSSLGRDAALQIDAAVSKVEDSVLKESIRRAMKKSFTARNTKA